MTGENQNPVTPGSTTATFGSDKGTTTTTVQFGSEDLDKVLNQNRHAQEHIKTLESETAQMREELRRMQEELAKAQSMDDFLSALKQQDTSQGTTSPSIDQEQLLKKLKAEVFKDLTTAQQKSLEEENWAKSIKSLRERHGDGYATYVDARAKELDIPVAKMEELAKTSPNAFLELVSPKGTRTAAPTHGSQLPPQKQDSDTEAMYTRVMRLRMLSTPEGLEARRTWEDPVFQSGYRLWILNKAKSAGSSFGNTI